MTFVDALVLALVGPIFLSIFYAMGATFDKNYQVRSYSFKKSAFKLLSFLIVIPLLTLPGLIIVWLFG